MRAGLAIVLGLALVGPLADAAWAQAPARTPDQAVVADPKPDAAHPANLHQIRYPTGGVEVPARFFVAAGAGPHPTVLLLHGLPGTELNLDLARAMQRAGWNVMAIHYRGLWGSPGQFSLTHAAQDARAALAYLHDPGMAEVIDAKRIVLVGHSMGGFATVMTGDDPGAAGFVTVSAWDPTADAPSMAPDKRAAMAASWSPDLSYTNITFDGMADDIVGNVEAWDWARNGAEMVGRPVLIIDSDDGLAPRGDALALAVGQAAKTGGGPAPTRLTFRTDHSYNDSRIALATAIVAWLRKTFPD